MKGIGFIFVFLPILGLNCAHFKKDKSKVEKTESYGFDSKKNFQSVLDDYIRRHQKNTDKYWLDGNEKPEVFASKVKKWKERVQKLVANSRSVSHRSQMIYKQFSDFEVRRFFAGTESEPISFCKEINYEKDSSEVGLPQVCVIPKEDNLLYKDRMPFPFWYYSEWDSLVVSCIDIPDAFLTALTYSRFWELLLQKRALMHHVDDCGCGPFATELEEVEMYELQHDILDSMVDGRLSKLYEDIQKRTCKISNPYTAFAYVTKEDLLLFDSIFEIEKQGVEMAKLSADQFFMGLGLSYIKNRLADSEQDDEKLIFYGWCKSIFYDGFDKQ